MIKEDLDEVVSAFEKVWENREELKMKGCFIKGEKIYLRSFNEGDIERWYQWFNDEEVTHYMDKRRFPNTPEKQLEFMKGETSQ